MGDGRHAQILVLGSGPAGCAAAVYAARAMREPLMLEGIQPGGQLTITTEVENYPGFVTVQGPDLMVQMREHAEAMGTRCVQDHIEEVDLSARPFHLRGEQSYRCDTLILATGAQAKWLGLPSEKKFKGHGVSACATCDGFFYRDKQVVVVGGGNTAVEEALFLTNFATLVTLVHRRDSLRAEKVLQKRLLDHPKIKVIWDHTLDEVIGEDSPLGVAGVHLQNVHSGETQELACAGVFIAIGHTPATELVRGQIDMDESGYIVSAPDSTVTSVPGVFAAGDVTDHVYRQAVTAAGMGCMAALEAERFLAEQATATG